MSEELDFKTILNSLLSRQDLSSAQVQDVMNAMMSGELDHPRTAAFLTAMRMKGETAAEVAGAAEIMRRNAVHVDAGAVNTIDTCGTGGSGLNAFNISTTSAFVSSGAGVAVAKHGNRAVSSASGSADVLAQLGFNLECDSAVMEQCLQEEGIAFLFAPSMHPSMKHVMPVRRSLGIRTMFNMLGPLSNPAGATGQLLGVYDPSLTEMFAEVLNKLGSRRAFVVHGEDGLDEITCTGDTRVSELRDGQVRTYDLNFEMLMGEVYPLADIVGGDAALNAEILLKVLRGEDQGACRATVLINSAAAIVAGEKADNIEEGLKLAAESIDSGFALKKMETLIEFSKS